MPDINPLCQDSSASRRISSIVANASILLYYWLKFCFNHVTYHWNVVIPIVSFLLTFMLVECQFG